MFNVKVEGFEIQFTFQHGRNLGLDSIGVSDVTACTIVINGQQFNGVAACSTKDKFDKSIGRKLSLERALQNVRKKIELPRVVRLGIWERYFDRDSANKDWKMEYIGEDKTYHFTGDIPKVAGPVS